MRDLDENKNKYEVTGLPFPSSWKKMKRGASFFEFKKPIYLKSALESTEQ